MVTLKSGGTDVKFGTLPIVLLAVAILSSCATAPAATSSSADWLIAVQHLRHVDSQAGESCVIQTVGLTLIAAADSTAGRVREMKELSQDPKFDALVPDEDATYVALWADRRSKVTGTIAFFG